MNEYEIETFSMYRRPDQTECHRVSAHSAADALTCFKANNPQANVTGVRCVETAQAALHKPELCVPQVGVELRRGDVIEFWCGTILREGTIEHVQGRAECPYVVGYEPSEGEHVEDEESNWNTYGMRLDEFVRLVSRPEPIGG